MTYLVDANILSEPTRPQPVPRVVEWLREHERELAVDPIVLGELQIGILGLPRGRKRTALETWFGAVVARIECLPWNATVSSHWARLVAGLKAKGEKIPLLDSMISATALSHDLIVVTRNVQDFRRAGVRVFNPFP